jgi:hypothetical protein
MHAAECKATCSKLQPTPAAVCAAALSLYGLRLSLYGLRATECSGSFAKKDHKHELEVRSVPVKLWCMLRGACCMLRHVACRMMLLRYVTCGLLSNMLPAACCMLRAACCVLRAACCVLKWCMLLAARPFFQRWFVVQIRNHERKRSLEAGVTARKHDPPPSPSLLHQPTSRTHTYARAKARANANARAYS